MGKVSVFFHGRPHGQKFWSTGDLTKEDSSYLEPFLDSRIGSDVSSAMIIDYLKGNAYYSYVVRKNVIEKERGTESYFAITLKIEKEYCKNVSKLYTLLGLVYSDKCEKAIFSKENNGLNRFRINGFEEVEGVLTEAKNVLVANFDKVIAQYVAPLASNADTSRTNSVTKYSNKEVDSAIFFEDCTNNKVVVSADYPRRDIGLQQEIKKLEQEKARVKEESDKETSRLQNQLADKQHDYECAVQRGNQLDMKVKELQSKLDSFKTAEDDIKRLKDENKKLNKESEDYKKQYNNKKSDCDNVLQEVGKHRQQIQQLNQQPKKKTNVSNDRNPDVARHVAGQFPESPEMRFHDCPKYYQGDNKKVWPNWVVIIAWTLLLAIGVVGATFSFLMYRQADEISMQKQDVESMSNDTNQVQTNQSVPHSVVSLNHGEEGYKIDITGNSTEWKVGHSTALKLYKKDVACEVSDWKVSGGAELDKDNNSYIKFTTSGTVKIYAKIVGSEEDTVIEREISVKE